MTYPTLSAAIAQEVADLIMAAPKKSQLSVDISESQFVVLKDGFDYDRVRIEKSSAAVQRSWEEKFSEKKIAENYLNILDRETDLHPFA